MKSDVYGVYKVQTHISNKESHTGKIETVKRNNIKSNKGFIVWKNESTVKNVTHNLLTGRKGD